MAMWLYQLNEEKWSCNKYRLDIWEGSTWEWEVGDIRRQSDEPAEPEPGDIVVFYYVRAGAVKPGFYGWAVVTRFTTDRNNIRHLAFRPAAPSDHLKMNPWD